MAFRRSSSLIIPGYRFEKQTITRGESYEREGRVHWNQVDTGSSSAVVQGTQPYEVRIDLGRAPRPGRLGFHPLKVTQARCTCPIFQPGPGCKHLYACLLSLEGQLKDRGLMPPDILEGLAQAEARGFEQAVEQDGQPPQRPNGPHREGQREHPNDGPRNRNFKSGQPHNGSGNAQGNENRFGQQRERHPNQNRERDPNAPQSNHPHQRREREQGQHPHQQRQGKLQNRQQGHGRQAQSLVDHFRTLLRAPVLRPVESDGEESGFGKGEGLDKRSKFDSSELHLVWDLSECQDNANNPGNVSVIRFCRVGKRMTTRAGHTGYSRYEESYWEPLTVPLFDLESVEDPALRSVLFSLFLHSVRSRPKAGAPWKPQMPKLAHAVGLNGRMFEALLPKLIATGRLYIADKFSLLPVPGTPLTMSKSPVKPRMWISPIGQAVGAGAEAGLSLELVSEETGAPVSTASPRLFHLVGLLGYVLVGNNVLSPLTIKTQSAIWPGLRGLAGKSFPRGEVQALVDSIKESQLALPPGFEVAVAPELAVPLEQLQPVARLVCSPGLAQGVLVPCRVYFDYGALTVAVRDTTPLLEDREGQRFIHRDEAAEIQLFTAISEFGRVALEQEQTSDLFIFQDRMRECFEFCHERGITVEIDGRRVQAKREFSLNVRSDFDWFEIDGKVSFATEENADDPTWSVPLDRVLRAILDGQQIIDLGDGKAGLIPAELERALSPLIRASAKNDDGGARRLSSSQMAFLLPGLEEKAQITEYDAGATTFRKELLQLQEFEPSSEPAGFEGSLRPYQKEGVGWLQCMGRLGLGACLADDMGLGKTVQVIALLQSLRNEKPLNVLLVAPRTLIDNWMREFKRFAPGLVVADLSRSDRAVKEALKGEASVYITTYKIATIDQEAFAAAQFDIIILDEAQNIKNAETQTAVAVRSFRARNRIVMTGTPVENGLGDLASLFRFLNPGLLELNTPLRQLAIDARSRAEVKDLEALTRSLKPFILRRTKAQVLEDLPPKTETVVHCEMTPGQKKLYVEAAREFKLALDAATREEGGLARSKIDVIQALLRLRQIACHPKLVHPSSRAKSGKFEYLLEVLEELIQEKRKVLLFSQFTSLLELLQHELEEKGWAHKYLDGSTRDRQGVIDEFNEASDVSLFLLSLKAGGVGLNLTSADTVFLLDPWWNPAVEAQAIDRAHRMGQKNAVNAFRLVAQETVEEKILVLQGGKKDLADAILDGSTSLLRTLTKDDLDYLLEA